MLAILRYAAGGWLSPNTMAIYSIKSQLCKIIYPEIRISFDFFFGKFVLWMNILFMARVIRQLPVASC